jgi:hypothetical protein
MDPYQTLGVSRTCTRAQVKEVFRTRAWYAHPDRGGEDEAFVRLCTAYKQILEELDQKPNAYASRHAPAPPLHHPDVPPDPSGKPDLIFVDDILPTRWPPKPSDPNWTADLVMLDEGSPVDRFPKPSDPTAARKIFVSGLHHIAAEFPRRRSRWRLDWAGAFGTLIVLAMIIGSFWGCWIAWTYAAHQAADAARPTPVESLEHLLE